MNRRRHPLGRPIGWTPGRPAKRRRTVGFEPDPCVDDVQEPETAVVSDAQG